MRWRHGRVLLEAGLLGLSILLFLVYAGRGQWQFSLAFLLELLGA